jgi:hypothetical protein
LRCDAALSDFSEVDDVTARTGVLRFDLAMNLPLRPNYYSARKSGRCGEYARHKHRFQSGGIGKNLRVLKALADFMGWSGGAGCLRYRAPRRVYELRQRRRGRKQGIAAAVAGAGEAAVAGEALQLADRAGLCRLDTALHPGQ